MAVNTINLNRHSWFKWSTPMDKSVEQVSGALLENQINECYIVPFYYKPGVEFYFKTNARKIKLYMSDTNSIDYNKSLLIKKYPELILTDRPQSHMVNTEKYSLVFKDEIIALYRKNEKE